jgi:molybdopterin molybdotransferase
MIGVDEAQRRILALATPLSAELMSLDLASGRFLADDIIAKRCQPAADLSAMDGYAIRVADLPGPFRLVGESAAGAPFAGVFAAGDAVRIFTGAHVPAGADTILIQEDVRADGNCIRLTGSGPAAVGAHIRRKGQDFQKGASIVPGGAMLTPGAAAATAMAGYGTVSVGRIPKIKILATGDELRSPGEACDAAHIPSSNNVMLRAMLATMPCTSVDAGIVPDDLAQTIAAFGDADRFDIIVTSGGASVGDHDFVQEALSASGAEIDFWRVAMKPGKPLMAARIGQTIVLGLPGNPASAFVTALLFLLPLVRYLAGALNPFAPLQAAPVGAAVKAGDNRAEYLRARLENGVITPFSGQDSGLITPLIAANALIIRPIGAPALGIGDQAPYIAL